MKTYTRIWIPSAIAVLALFNTTQARPDGQPQLLLFLSGGPTYNEVAPDIGPEGSDFVVDADIVFSYLDGRFRLLGEYILSTEESELERFHVGWQINDQNLGWIGRFHTPSSYWNFNYHHGQYLQTSITRPHIEQFEDDAGFLPAHITGMMLETAFGTGVTGGYSAALSLGAAPVIDDNELRPLGFEDEDPDNKLSIDLRITFMPDQLDENQVGLIASRSDLLIDGSQYAVQQGIQNVEQYRIGLYADWRYEEWRFISSLIRVTNKLIRLTSSKTESFYAGYVQAENMLDRKWTLFGRLEGTSDRSRTEYLELFANSVIERQLLGLRYDLFRSHALTIEFAQAETRSEEFDQVMLQWSAVLP